MQNEHFFLLKFMLHFIKYILHVPKVRSKQVWQDRNPRESNQTVPDVLTLSYLIVSYLSMIVSYSPVKAKMYNSV